MAWQKHIKTENRDVTTENFIPNRCPLIIGDVWRYRTNAQLRKIESRLKNQRQLTHIYTTPEFHAYPPNVFSIPTLVIYQ